jgi:hypothetical protein
MLVTRCKKGRRRGGGRGGEVAKFIMLARERESTMGAREDERTQDKTYFRL